MAMVQQLDDITSDPPDRPENLRAARNCTDDTNVETETKPTEGDIILTTGGTLTSDAPLRITFARAALLIGLFTSILGLCIVSLGVTITAYFKFRTSRSCPLLWWAGLAPFLMGVAGVCVGVRKTRKYLLYWGMWTFILAVTTVSGMLAVGNLSTAQYSVWPPISKHKGQDLCKIIQDSCFCQNIYQGVLSHRITLHTRYFHEDLWWKDTGFSKCEDVYTVSKLYYSTMACVGLYLLLSVCGLCVGFAGSVCCEPDTEIFRKLEEETEEGNGISSA